MKSIRIIFYIVALVVTVVAVSIHKKSIIASRQATPPSVLSILMEKGAPVLTYDVKSDTITELTNFSLEKCGTGRCFYVTRLKSKNLKKGNSVYSQELKEIGKISNIQGIDSSTGLIRVNVDIKKDFLKDQKNSFNIVKVAGLNIKNALVIPNNSIDYDSTSSFVWLYNNGKPEKKHIKLGITSSLFTEVKDGLKAGDTVVTEGQGLLLQYNKARNTADTNSSKDPI